MGEKTDQVNELAEEVLPAEGKSRIFIPLAKVDEKRQEVWGFAAVEQEDHAGEIMDYQSSAPYFVRWSQVAFVPSAEFKHRPLNGGLQP